MLSKLSQWWSDCSGDFIVIVALLSFGGIFFYPRIMGARERARTSSCQSNLKQIGLAIAMYKNDYNEQMPIADSFPRLSDALLPYLKSCCIWWCPSGLHPVNNRKAPMSYAWNTLLNGKADKEIGDLNTPTVWDREPWHNHGRNVLVYDGHVDWHGSFVPPVSAKDIYTPCKCCDHNK